MILFDLIFIRAMSGKDERRVNVFTTFSKSQRYVTESTIKSLGKEEQVHIIPSPKFWKAFKQYEKYQTYTEGVFCPLPERELGNKLKGSLSLTNAKKRIAVVGFPYHRLSKTERSVEFFFIICEKLIADLFNWYDKVVFVPPKPNFNWGSEGLLKLHDQFLEELRSQFKTYKLEIVHQKHRPLKHTRLNKRLTLQSSLKV